MVPFVRRHRTLAILAVIVVVAAVALCLARLDGPATATSGGDPYVVPLVVDTNPDPDIVETTIMAEPASVDLGNGVTASALTFNGSIPGPQFRLKVGDTVIVHYVNNLGHPSAIHWHGIELSNPNDGTPLTQDMVPPFGGTFEYKFKVTRPGIFWYHPHHHSSTNQVFKGLYGTIIVSDPNEAALQASGALPSPADTKTIVLSDATVCKDTYTPGEPTYDPSLPFVGGGALPAQSPTPEQICKINPVDEDGNPTAPFAGGTIPNIQTATPGVSIVEGNIVLTNGKNVGGRAGSPAAPGALAAGASLLDVRPGQGLRLQLLNTAPTRFFRLRLTDEAGTLIPLVRIGGQGGLLDEARIEGGVVGGFDFKYDSGQILLDPGDRQDVVVAIPSSATGVLTMWTEDFNRTGNGFSHIPTVPVMHLNVTGSPVVPEYTIGAGAALRSATGHPVEALGSATAVLIDPSTLPPAVPPLLGTNNQTIELNNQVSGKLAINGTIGVHDFSGAFTDFPHSNSSRYAEVGDTLELMVANKTQGAHHPFHLHGFSMQPLSLTKTAGGGPDYAFGYNEFRDNIDVPPGYTLHFRVRVDDRNMSDGVTPGGAVGRWVFHCHIFFHAVFGMISEFVVVPSTKPVLSLPGDQTQDYHDDLTFGISATDPNGDPITLGASGLPAGLTFTDHSDGTGTVAGTLTAPPGVYLATFSASDGNNPPVTGTVKITVTREETTTTYTGPAVILNGSTVTLSAALKEDGLVPISGKTINFTLGGQGCNGATNGSGVANCSIAVSQSLGTSIPITASFPDGDTFYLPSSASTTAVVFAFPSRGAFVLGDLSAVGSGTQTWWDSTWAKLNDLGDGASVSAFKGFAGTVSLPTATPPASCGGPWSTSGGTSPAPPETVPSFMGVLVASGTAKSGSTISGNTAKIVVVQTNPGYAPNAGSPGTGVIVATYCTQ